jgi:DedD protein
MDQGLKQRLVGAGVIIALAVIFIPLLLENPDNQQADRLADIPSEPFVVISKIEPPQVLPAATAEQALQESRITDPGNQLPVQDDMESVAIPASDSDSASATTSVTADSESGIGNAERADAPVSASIGKASQTDQQRYQAAQALLQAEREAVQQRVQAAKNLAANPPVTDSVGVQAAAPQALAKAWTIQLAAFASETNARRLYEKLLADGFKAYIKPTKPPGRILYRVYVGPEIREERATMQRDALQQAYRLTGIVVRYAP